ncbi:MAG: serine hydrolase [Myxococcota bacterium]|nr:serine hydrolase [Myxococcota bacterium]
MAIPIPLARRAAALFALCVLLVSHQASRADAPEEEEADPRGFLETIRQPEELQVFLDATIEQLLASDAALRRQNVRVSIIDLPNVGAPELAHWNGDSPVYPASVVKFVYLMAAYAWRDEGKLEIDPAFDRQLDAMIYVSSNRATQRVVRRLTGTEAGERLDAEGYADFRERRHRVKRWLQGLGIEGLHAVHPTYDGGGDLHGRDLQFLKDKTVPGCLPNQKGPYFNRQAMTANDTARLLALLAEDLALSPESSAEVRERMRRDPRKQRYLFHRVAGGADLRPDLEVFSKTGTWGPIFADAGIVRHWSGHQLVVAVFIEGKPAYRGPFIAELTRRSIARVLPAPRTASVEE